jgi:hypothetical protein
MTFGEKHVETLGRIHDLLVTHNKLDPDKTYSWIDPESNTIWMLGDEDELIRYTHNGPAFADMTDEDLSNLVAVIKALDEEVNNGFHLG